MTGYRTKTESERFWSHVEVRGDDECWPWQAGLRPRGHGQFNTEDGRNVGAHRFAYEDKVGPIPDGLLVRHSCDNPPCCNPKHLLPGTHQDNVDDMRTRGTALQPTCRRGHPRTPENVYHHGGKRYCRVCRS